MTAFRKIPIVHGYWTNRLHTVSRYNSHWDYCSWNNVKRRDSEAPSIKEPADLWRIDIITLYLVRPGPAPNQYVLHLVVRSVHPFFCKLIIFSSGCGYYDCGYRDETTRTPLDLSLSKSSRLFSLSHLCTLVDHHRSRHLQFVAAPSTRLPMRLSTLEPIRTRPWELYTVASAPCPATVVDLLSQSLHCLPPLFSRTRARDLLISRVPTHVHSFA